MVSWLKVPHQIEPKRLGDVKYYIFDETTILQEIARIDMTKQRFEIYKNAYTKMTGFEASVEDREQFRILSLGSNKALGSLVRCFEILFDGNQNYLADLRVVHIEGIFYLPAPKKMFKLALIALILNTILVGGNSQIISLFNQTHKYELISDSNSVGNLNFLF